MKQRSANSLQTTSLNKKDWQTTGTWWFQFARRVENTYRMESKNGKLAVTHSQIGWTLILLLPSHVQEYVLVNHEAMCPLRLCAHSLHFHAISYTFVFFLVQTPLYSYDTSSTQILVSAGHSRPTICYNFFLPVVYATHQDAMQPSMHEKFTAIAVHQLPNWTYTHAQVCTQTHTAYMYILAFKQHKLLMNGWMVSKIEPAQFNWKCSVRPSMCYVSKLLG